MQSRGPPRSSTRGEISGRATPLREFDSADVCGFVLARRNCGDTCPPLIAIPFDRILIRRWDPARIIMPPLINIPALVISHLP